MKKQARPVVTLITAAILGSSLTGCGGGGGAASPAPAPTPAPAPVVTAPGVTTPPANQTVDAGQAATFTVTATGGGTLSYQWQRDGKDIVGATGASYSLSVADLSDSGAAFRAVVTNTAGSVTSSAATLTVKTVAAAPSVVTQPQATSALDGGTATFTVGVSGTGPFTYRWQLNGVDIADAFASSYTTPTLSLADNGANYRVVITNGAGAVTSSAAALTIKPRTPVVTQSPTSLAVSAGQAASFMATANGSAPLSYQWQRNGADIAGATSASYTTPALATGDSGTQYRVLVTNAAGSVTSSSATVTVTAATVAPTVSTGPQPASVTVGQPASFNVTVVGSAPLSYQWQRNGADITGATSASYTLAATTLTDSGARYAVRVSNPAGTVTSSSASLTVNALVSPLAGRAWTPGKLLEADDNNVGAASYDIDDQGRVNALFLKSDGTRAVLYATRGTPGAAGAEPAWTAPVAIDVLEGKSVNSMTLTDNDFAIAVAPNGNAVARWYGRGACTANTYQTFGNCNYLFTARYLAASDKWEAPVLVADSPSVKADMAINAAGDIAVALTGWKRSGSSSYTSAAAVAWRPAAATAFQSRVFSEASISTFRLGMDGAGNLLMAAEVNQNATTDLVAYRGTQAAGFGAPMALENRGAVAKLAALAVGRNGQQMVLFTQNNGTSSTLFAASATSASGAFDVVDIGGNGAVQSFTSPGWTAIADDGRGFIYDIHRWQRLRWTNGTWAANWERLPAADIGPTAFGYGANRNGDFVLIGGTVSNAGLWGSYDGASNVWVQEPKASYVLGVRASAGYAPAVLSINGQGAALMLNKFDVLPTAPAPAGDGRNVSNLWSTVLK